MHRRFKSWLSTSKAQSHLDINRLTCTLDDNKSPPNHQRTPEGLKIHTKAPVLRYLPHTVHFKISHFRRFIFLSCAKGIPRPTQTADSNRIRYTASYADRNRVAVHLISWHKIHEVRRHGGDSIKGCLSTSVPLLRKLVLSCILPIVEIMLQTFFSLHVATMEKKKLWWLHRL